MVDNYAVDMFNVPLLHLNIDDWENKKPLLLDMMSKNMDYFSQRVSKDLNSNNIKIESILKTELDQFNSYFNFTHCKIHLSWFNKAVTGDYHTVHNHSVIGYSSVCYIEYDHDEHTPLEFISPFNNFLTGETIYYIPQVTEGSIIFFPSAILHYTLPNKSKKDRSILAFNLDVK